MVNKWERLFFESAPVCQRALLTAIGCIFFIPFIGGVHLFDWDEINFAEITREMLLTKEFFIPQIDFVPFYQKPPFFNWLQAIGFTLFGQGEFAARLPNAIFGVFSLLLMFEIGRILRDKAFGMLWALLYMGSILPFFYFKSGVIDPVFNFLIFLSYCLLFLAYKKDKTIYFLLAGLANGLAIITKGPVGFLLVVLSLALYRLLYRRTFSIRSDLARFFLFALGALIPTLAWLTPQFLRAGDGFAVHFTAYMVELLTKDVAGHAQPFYYHFLVVFIGCFPISAIALPYLMRLRTKSSVDFSRWMFCLFWVVLIVFSIVKTKIVHYSSMTYFPLAYLAADVLTAYKEGAFKKGRFLKLFLWMGLLLTVAFLALPLLFIYKEWLLSLLSKDAFAAAIARSMAIPPLAPVCALVFLTGIIAAYYFFRRRQIRIAVLTYAVCMGIFINALLYLILPPVEEAVQGPAIAFYKRFAGKDVYLTTSGFFSYGKTYYFDKQPRQAKYSDEQLLNSPVDKPVYIVAKAGLADDLIRRADMRLVEQKGAFLLFEKLPAASPSSPK